MNICNGAKIARRHTCLGICNHISHSQSIHSLLVLAKSLAVVFDWYGIQAQLSTVYNAHKKEPINCIWF